MFLTIKTLPEALRLEIPVLLSIEIDELTSLNPLCTVVQCIWWVLQRQIFANEACLYCLCAHQLVFVDHIRVEAVSIERQLLDGTHLAR